MKHTLLLFATALLLGIQSHAQTGVAINPTGAEADSCAMLDVSSTTKGLLVPRMTETQRSAIVRPVKGLLVYQNDGTEGFYYFDGSTWTKLASGTFTETDPVFGLSAAHGITSANISDWDTAYSWGDHAGLYRPVAWVPTWNDISGNPFHWSSPANGDLMRYDLSTEHWENFAPEYLTSYTETDPVYSSKFDPTGASNGDLLKFNGTKFVKSTSNFNESNYVHNGRYGVKLLARNDAQTNLDLVIQPKGTGAILAQQPDSTAAGGNDRGLYALDLQTRRVNGQQVASGNYSTIAGGRNNTACGMYSLASGHYNNAQSYAETVMGMFATIGTGDPDEPNIYDRLFVIGNGSSSNNRLDALRILKNGSTAIGGTLTINGNGTSYTFPASRGTNGNVLTTDGSGGTSWTAPASGTVTGVTGTAPIVSTGGATPAISINAATTTTSGSMSASDKAKLDAQTTGTMCGQMQYWNGTAWVIVAVGTYGQVLEFRAGGPVWIDKNINYLSIGDAYKGGIIAYFLQSGDPGYDANVRHGLIASPSDQNSNAIWGCYGTNISGAAGTALGTGAQNTTDIVGGCNATEIAAGICNDLDLNGYDDWFLPSADELNKLYQNKVVIGSFATDQYWSSTEYNSAVAWRQSFIDGNQNTSYKTVPLSVRAVRAF